MVTCKNCLHIDACKQWYPQLPDKYHDGCEFFAKNSELNPEIEVLLKYRFKTKSIDDYRPLIDMSEIHMPWWCTGFSIEDNAAIIVCYLPKGENLFKYWDDAFDIDTEIKTKIEYSERFPKPNWL